MPPKTRKSIPKQIKDQVWDTYAGKDNGICMCFCCEKKELRQSSFHAGHIQSVAEGGTDTIDNLRPICRSCNLSMGTQNMNEYKEHYKPHVKVTPIAKAKGRAKPKTQKLDPVEVFKKDKSTNELYDYMKSNSKIIRQDNYAFVYCKCGKGIGIHKRQDDEFLYYLIGKLHCTKEDTIRDHLSCYFDSDKQYKPSFEEFKQSKPIEQHYEFMKDNGVTQKEKIYNPHLPCMDIGVETKILCKCGDLIYDEKVSNVHNHFYTMSHQDGSQYTEERIRDIVDKHLNCYFK